MHRSPFAIVPYTHYVDKKRVLRPIALHAADPLPLSAVEQHTRLNRGVMSVPPPDKAPCVECGHVLNDATDRHFARCGPYRALIDE
jgi:hypothetical protein